MKEERHRFDRQGCAHCGACVRRCPAAALKIAGKTMSVEEVMNEVRKDRLFYENSGGGITLSGGEPFFHPEFSAALLKAAKREQMNTCVETCGVFPFDQVLPCLDQVDLWLYDLKASGTEKHRSLTGAGNEKILENLRRLNRRGARLILRCPLIPGINGEEEHLRRLAALASELKQVERIEIEPYHDFGICKYHSLGRKPELDIASATTEQTEIWLEILRRYTDVPVRQA